MCATTQSLGNFTISFYVFTSVLLWRLLWQILNVLFLLLLLCFSGVFNVIFAFCCCRRCGFLSACLFWGLMADQVGSHWTVRPGRRSEARGLQNLVRPLQSLSGQSPSKTRELSGQLLGAHSKLPQIARSSFLCSYILGEDGVDMVYITLGRPWLCHMATSVFGEAVKKKERKEGRRGGGWGEK